jgi:hypothetical protein
LIARSILTKFAYVLGGRKKELVKARSHCRTLHLPRQQRNGKVRGCYQWWRGGLEIGQISISVHPDVSVAIAAEQTGKRQREMNTMRSHAPSEKAFPSASFEIA